MSRERVLIMGAAGKDFHIFNTIYRDNPAYQVVSFTATQIPTIDNRLYPPCLAGKLYPDGIPIKSERFLSSLIRDMAVEKVVFAYSDVSFEYIEAKRQKVEAAGARFNLAPVDEVMLAATRPVIAVCAVRTGSGKSQTTRRIVDILKAKNKKVVVVRHPMPYGDLASQVVARYETLSDLDRYNCTIEEREDIEPHLNRGVVVYTGVDYQEVLKKVEKEAEVIIWDGGNNDIPFFRPNLWITVLDPLRHGHELNYYPGRLNFERADVLIINKMDSANAENVVSVKQNIRQYNPRAIIIKANSPIQAENPELIKGKKVLVVEDGPTVTHGEMKFGAGYLAAQKYGASQIIDPRPYARGSLPEVFQQYPHIEAVLPAIGYSKSQIKALEETINAVPCELVLMATPTDLTRYIRLNKPALRITYELEEIEKPDLIEVLSQIII